MIYDLAGLRINLNNRYSFTEKFCRGYLSADQHSSYDFSAEVSENEFFREKTEASGHSDGYIENICLLRSVSRQLPRFGRILLHAAVVEYENEGFAFLGKSGTGKSTHAALWTRYLPSAKILNGDKPILRLESGRFYAYGTPWTGKENEGERKKVSLRALCFLEQRNENLLRKLSPKELSGRLLQQLFLPSEKEELAAALELADMLISSVPSYLLQCNISEGAVRTAFEGMTGKEYLQEICSERKHQKTAFCGSLKQQDRYLK